MIRLAEILLTTTIAQRRLDELRALRSSTAHVPSGPHGGEFTSGPGSHGKTPHGKHHARNERRKAKKKLLNKLRTGAYAKVKKLKAKHRKIRDDLREVHKKLGTPQHHAREQQAQMRANHAIERRKVLEGIKSEIHAEVAKAGFKGHGSGKKAEAFREAKVGPLRELEKTQRGDRKLQRNEQRGEWKDLKKTQQAEHKDLHKEERIGRQEERADYRAQRAELIADSQAEHREVVKELKREFHKKEMVAERKITEAIAAGKPNRAKKLEARIATIRTEHEATVEEYHENNQDALRYQVDYLKSEHRDRMRERKAEHATDVASLHETHREERIELRDRSREDRDFYAKERRDERKAVIGEVKAEFDEAWTKNKGRSEGGRKREEQSHGQANQVGRHTERQGDHAQWDYLPGRSSPGERVYEIGDQDRSADPNLLRQGSQARFGRHQTHKASNAEAILAHCLRRRGWTVAYREGRLTNRQHLQLLEDVRQYGRRWLRHEAEGFFRAYGVSDDLANIIFRDLHGHVGGDGTGVLDREDQEDQGRARTRGIGEVRPAVEGAVHDGDRLVIVGNHAEYKEVTHDGHDDRLRGLPDPDGPGDLGLQGAVRLSAGTVCEDAGGVRCAVEGELGSVSRGGGSLLSYDEDRAVHDESRVSVESPDGVLGVRRDLSDRREDNSGLLELQGDGVNDGHGRFPGLAARTANGVDAADSGATGDGTTRARDQAEMVSRSLGVRLLSPLKRFFERVRQFTHELIIAGTLALKDNEPLSASETAAIDQAAKVQADYLDNFQRQVIANPPVALIEPGALETTSTVVLPPPMTGPQFIARAELYANAAHQVPQNIVRQAVVGAAVMTHERLVLGDPKVAHCSECPPDAALGWVPIGTLRPIGARECSFQCLCHFEYTDQAPTAAAQPAAATVNTRRPRKILLKKTPYTKSKKLWRPETPEDIAAKEKFKRETTPREPTAAEIDAEVKKWIAGKPSRITIRPPGEPPQPPREGGGWHDEHGRPVPGFTLPPQSTPVAPAGYETTQPSRYDAAGNLVID